LKKIGFMFPGQGSQLVGMGKDFYDQYSWAEKIYNDAGILLGFDLADVSFNGPEEKLRQTRFTQPALYVHSMVVATALKEKNIVPDVVAGHSLGEFSALACAGAFTLEEGLRLVKERADLMQKAGELSPGSMAAIIGMSCEDVEDICREASKRGIVQPANINSPQQIVISGSREGIEEAIKIAEKRGAKRVIELPVSGAFHSPLMSYASESFGSVLEKTNFSKARIPVYANVTASPVRECDEIRSLLHKQLLNPVRWLESVQNMIRDGVSIFIEVGAGKVLSGLVKRIDRDVTTFQCSTVEDVEKIKF